MRKVLKFRGLLATQGAGALVLLGEPRGEAFEVKHVPTGSLNAPGGLCLDGVQADRAIHLAGGW